MKRLIIMVACLAVLGGGVAQVSAECGPCPPEDIVIFYMDPVFGPKFLKIKKGHFDDPDTYWTMEEWESQTSPPKQEPPEEPKEKGKNL